MQLQQDCKQDDLVFGHKDLHLMFPNIHYFVLKMIYLKLAYCCICDFTGNGNLITISVKLFIHSSFKIDKFAQYNRAV